MAEQSGIEYVDATWNITSGCTPVTAGCVHCWARRLAEGRLRGRFGYPAHDPFRVTVHPERLLDPLRGRKPKRIFVSSMGDLFHERIPFEFIDQVMAVMALTPQHTYLLVTKRAQRMADYALTRWAMDDSGRVDRLPPWYQIATGWLDEGDRGFLRRRWNAAHRAAEQLDPSAALPNVVGMVSVEHQEAANYRIPPVLGSPFALRGVSCEPLLGPVDFINRRGPEVRNGKVWTEDWLRGKKGDCTGPKLDWVIVGGETGPGARPMHPDWVRSIRDQCKAAGVPFFFKAWGDWAPTGPASATQAYVSHDGRWWPMSKVAEIESMDRGQVMYRVGRKEAGRVLDGVEHNEYPAPEESP